MSFSVISNTEFPQTAFQYVPQEILGENAFEDLPTLGGILSDLKHTWHAKGPCLEVRNIATGRKVGSWTFGCVLRDWETKISAVAELKREPGKLPLLVVALDCPLSAGLICVFDIFGSKVVRVVQIGEHITNIHIIDSACNVPVLPQSSPLIYFDGIVGIGTVGGNVYLLDLCKQICENAVQNAKGRVRNEVDPCQMVILNKEKISNIKKYVERSVEQEEHLAIHLNVILHPSTEHFTLKGENGDDRVHVNRKEAEISALFYSPQIASLLVGYNFGAFQMWDIRSLDLLYTSPVCDEHIPVTHFTVQEPADDPKAYCYIWVSYSHNLTFHAGLPFAVMYSFYFDKKQSIKGYGNLYDDFQHCSIRFQLELGDTESSMNKSRVKGGTCVGLQSISKSLINKDLSPLALCFISWLVWDSEKEVSTSILLFDLNQWYKEQMPRMPNWSDCSNYIIRNSLMGEHLLDIKLDQKVLSQFMGIQRLEEHFCPTSLSFDLWGITENSIIKIHNTGLQKSFLDKIVNDQHLALIKPEDYSEQIITLGLIPLFCDVSLNNSMDIDYQRDVLLSMALEQKLLGWLCQTTAKLANNAFNSSGLTLNNVLNWAFQRAVTLKNSCDNYCVPLFDYSGIRLDDNTLGLITCCLNQIRDLCSFYGYVSNKLRKFVSDVDSLLEEQRSLENVVVYFEVLRWMVSIGLLPEYQPRGSVDSLLGVPYMVDNLTQYYNRKRTQLQVASMETFIEKDSLLFIDNMINFKGSADILRQQWQEDGGSGLYPPPSLQSLLRTYFLDGPDMVFKHCLVTYTLLDIAMTVDEHNKVIKLLLKFPQIFNLSQSNIKIVQAFWHLDHDDYQTALDSILDSCVLAEDFEHWHHSVMMKSLLLQDQSRLALLYLQVGKPAIRDEKDVLTVISLLISRNMLDEAFKFRLQYKVNNPGPEEDLLLTHIFNECDKNELLHTLLYRQMNAHEEKAFFKYLQNRRNSKCDDLQVFYYLLRSRFLEAFDTHSLTKKRQPDTQGLVGQRGATTADNVVKMFKSLLPDVNRNLLELVRKERTNLWKEVQKPAPLSVFVHNAKHQVHYKSSVIFAALAKAKETFNETVNDSKFTRDVVSEETPFLRTPSALRNQPRDDTPLLKSRIIEQNEQGEELGVSPCKKLKLSPRTSKASPIKSRNLYQNTPQKKLSTPIVKRKRQSLETMASNDVLPQSILKSGSKTILDDSVFDERTSINTFSQMECENSVRRSKLGLSPRKTLRTPLKSHVKFDDLRYSGSPTDQNGTVNSPIDNSNKQSKDSISSVPEDVFYSPEHSLETDETGSGDKSKVEETPSKIITQSKEELTFDEAIEKYREVQDNRMSVVEEQDLSRNRMNFQSPKSRRSYKRSFSETVTPIRASPRLAKKASAEEPPPTPTKSESPLPSPSVQKLHGRRSLSRSVLENNAFSLLKCRSLLADSKSSARSSLNTTFNDTDTDVDEIECPNTTLNALLEEIRKADEDMEPSFANSPAGDEALVSRSKEIRNLVTCRESLRRRGTGDLVSSSEVKKSFVSKTVEEFGGESGEKEANVNKDVSAVINNEENISRNRQVDLSNIDDKVPTTENEHENKEEEFNVYDDLSSGSEDIKEVLRNRNQECPETPNTNKSCSTSFYQTEKRELEMPYNFLDNGESSNSNDIQPENVQENVEMYDFLSDDVPEAERAILDNGEVIEIGSSSDDSARESDVHYSSKSPEVNFDPIYFSDSGSISSSNVSVRGSDVSNESYNLNVSFEENLNEEEQNIEEKYLDYDSDNDRSIAKEDDFVDEEPTSHSGGKSSRKETEDAVKSITGNLALATAVESSDEEMEPLVIQDYQSCLAVETGQSRKESVTDDQDEPKDQQPNIALVDNLDKTSAKAVGVQCLLEVNDKPGSDEQTSCEEIIKIAETSTSPQKQSVGLQCTLGTREFDSPNSDEAEQEDTENQLNKDGTPLILRTIKRTYIRPKTAVNVDATPKLALVLTKRTYSKTKVCSKLFDNDRKTEDNNVQDEGLIPKETEAQDNSSKKSHSDDMDVEPVPEMPSVSPKVPNNDDMDVEPVPEMQSEDNKKGDDPVPSDHEENKDLEVTSKENKLKITDPEGQVISHEEIVKKGETDRIEPTPIRLTRRRSALLSQQEAMLGSQTEESIAAGSTTEDPGTSTSSSSTSRSISRRHDRKRSLNESAFDNVSLLSPEKEDVMDTSLLGEKPTVLRKADESSKKKEIANKKRASRKVLSNLDDGNTSQYESPKVKTRASKTEIPKTTKKLDLPGSEKPRSKGRTRSASVDQPISCDGAKIKSGRSKSIDLNDIKIMKGQAELTVINEIPEPSTSKYVREEGPKGKSRASSHLGEYTTSRRLTRKQANMLKTIGSVEKEIKKLPAVEELDPLHLLDKGEFDGEPDPEEAKIYEPDSPSNSSETGWRQTRSASVLSDAPTTPSRRKLNIKDSPISGIKSRLRRTSTDTLSAVSEKSDSPSPPKKTKKVGEHDSPPTRSNSKARSRTSSVSSAKSTKSDKTNVSTRTTRSHRLNSARNELPEIEEEKTGEENDATNKSASKRRYQKKKEQQ